jgi:hypothetical protein
VQSHFSQNHSAKPKEYFPTDRNNPTDKKKSVGLFLSVGSSCLDREQAGRREKLFFVLLRYLAAFDFSLYAVGIAFVIVLSGCAGRAPKMDRDWQPRELYARVAENYRRLQTFRGRGSLTIESPQMRLNTAAEILAVKPDSLFIKVEASLGVDVGFFFVDRRQFASFSPLENVYYYGETEKIRELMFFRMELSYDEMLSGLLGAALPPFDSSFTVARDGDQYRFDGRRRRLASNPARMMNTNGIHDDTTTTEQDEAAWRLSYWVNADGGVVTKAEQRYDDGELFARQEFKRFRRVPPGGIWLPQLIQMERPAERERMTIFYNRVEANKKITPAEFAIRVPKNAKRVELSSDPAALPELKNF